MNKCQVCKAEEASLLCTMRVTSLNKKIVHNTLTQRVCGHCCSWLEDRFDYHHPSAFVDPNYNGPMQEGWQLHAGD